MLKVGMYVRCPIDREYPDNPRLFATGKILGIDEFNECVHIKFYDPYEYKAYFEYVPDEVQEAPLKMLDRCHLFKGAVVKYGHEIDENHTYYENEAYRRLKGKTGIKNWNVLCRWALCYSLSEKTVPTDIPIVADSNLEMSWFTFGGDYYELYEALVKAWCIEMGLGIDDETVAKYFKLNLERGISHLCGTGFIKSIDDLVNLAIKEA